MPIVVIPPPTALARAPTFVQNVVVVNSLSLQHSATSGIPEHSTVSTDACAWTPAGVSQLVCVCVWVCLWLCMLVRLGVQRDAHLHVASFGEQGSVPMCLNVRCLGGAGLSTHTFDVVRQRCAEQGSRPVPNISLQVDCFRGELSAGASIY